MYNLTTSDNVNYKAKHHFIQLQMTSNLCLLTALTAIKEFFLLIPKTTYYLFVYSTSVRSLKLLYHNQFCFYEGLIVSITIFKRFNDAQLQNYLLNC